MPRALIVGGSLGGLFAAAMLLRAGWEVTVVERSETRLTGRGAGLGVHPAMLRGLLRAGARVDATVGVPVAGRTVFARSGNAVAEIAMPQLCTSWQKLYILLSDCVPEPYMRRGAALAAFEQDGGGVTARLADGSELRVDLLIGADGWRSTVRRQLAPEIEFGYAGYIAWRGLAEEAAFSPTAHAALFHRFAFDLPEGEQMLGYPVPGADETVEPGKRRFNFVWYRPVAAERLPALQTGSDGRLYPDGIPPRAIRPELVASLRRDAEALLSPAFAEVVRIVEEPLFQPIGDLEAPRMAYGRVALLGDAAFVARPHVGMGAIKAGEDAIALADALAALPVEEALKQYDAVRRLASAALVAEGRRLGAYLEGRLGRVARDPVRVLQENGGVRRSAVDGGLFLRLLAEAGFN